MKKWIVILGAVLIAQLVLVVIVYISGDDYSAYEANEKLLVFDVDTVDRILINDGSSSAVIDKLGENWVLPEQNNFPADQNSVDQLLNKLATMKRGLPIATTSGASRRFKVVEDEFESKLSLFANNGALGELYIGDSPGFRKVHVRKVEEAEVYAVEFNTWEASANLVDWIDKHILTFAMEDLLQVEMPGFILERENDELQLANISNQEKINQIKVQELANSLSSLQIDSLLNNTEKEKLPDQADFTFNVTLAPDTLLTYNFYQLDEEPFYLLKRTDFDASFKIAEFYVNTVKESTRDQLLLAETEEEPEEIIESSNTELIN